MNRHEEPINVGARKRIGFLILALALLGLFGIQNIIYYFDELKTLADHDPELALIKLKRFSSILLVVNGVATSAFAFYFMSMGWRTWKRVRTSSEEKKDLTASGIRTAARAKIIALICLLLALLILSTNAIMWYLYTVLEKPANIADCNVKENHGEFNTRCSGRVLFR